MLLRSQLPNFPFFVRLWQDTSFTACAVGRGAAVAAVTIEDQEILSQEVSLSLFSEVVPICTRDRMESKHDRSSWLIQFLLPIPDSTGVPTSTRKHTLGGCWQIPL
eukprot:5205416-Amphidinium_carterae.1